MAKILAGRPRDLDDVVGILQMQGKGLDHSDLSSALARAIQRAAHLSP